MDCEPFREAISSLCMRWDSESAGCSFGPFTAHLLCGSGGDQGWRKRDNEKVRSSLATCKFRNFSHAARPVQLPKSYAVSMASQKHSTSRFAKSIPPRFSEASDAPTHACAPELERPEPM